MKTVNLIIAENLKCIRVSKGWSQSFVASQLGISQRTISRVECGVSISKRTLKKLCNLYQITVASVYDENVQEQPRGMQVVPDDVATALLIKTEFVKTFEQEVILRYTNTIQKSAFMMREDVEQIIPQALSMKQSYSLQDIITACMLTNQITLSNIRKLAIT